MKHSINKSCSSSVCSQIRVSSVRCKLCVTLIALMMHHPVASAQSDPDWPCIQALVSVVEIGVLWPEVIPESDVGQWKRDDRIAPLARKLGALANYTDAERLLVEQFFDETPEGEQVSALNRLAEGTLAIANQRRSHYIKGIKKYTKQQTAISLQIQDGLNRLAQLEKGEVEASENELEELKETMEWHERVFDQREHSMIALCDQPVLVEQTTSSVLRDLAQYLP